MTQTPSTPVVPAINNPLIALKKLFDNQQSIYDNNKRFLCLLSGAPGCGKTQACGTARTPILYISTDPGGCQTLIKAYAKEIADGKIFFINVGEREDMNAPCAFTNTLAQLNYLTSTRAIQKFATIIVDSVTTLTMAVMGHVQHTLFPTSNQARKGASSTIGSQPTQAEYGLFSLVFMRFIFQLLSLKDDDNNPLDFILVAHTRTETDEKGNVLAITPSILTNKLRTEVPAMFSERYHYSLTPGAGGTVNRKLVTAPDGVITASSRLPVDKYEPIDFTAIMKKAGIYRPDKEPITFTE